MIGTGASFAANTGVAAVYNSAAPAQLNIPSFDNGRRVRVVVIPLPGASRFHINFRTHSDIAYHFNPRFDV
ncbi:hypothetical protein OESDEN_21208 [Oesophagostomum dentatum]|nr:hypothetical protein OESDEN_21208 [Oesophagostomum dentatum]